MKADAHAKLPSNQAGLDPILSVRGLNVTFSGHYGSIEAVRGVDFDVYPGEVFCIVGESGSGKSVTSLAVTRLLPDTARIEGSIRLAGVEVTTADDSTLRSMRGTDVGVVFQDPMTTLNPLLTVGRQVVEGQVAHHALSRGRSHDRAADLLHEVDIPDARERARQYPHQFSGGMRQRAVIAMAMAGKPSLIIADEPTTALDVTVQAQVLAVLAKRQAATGAAVILITHDLGVVAEVAHRVAVMYGGRIVETGPVEETFKRPRHPYTLALMRSMPRIDSANSRLDSIPGQPPAPGDLPSGCSFHPRCALSQGRLLCRESDPHLRPSGHMQESACHFFEELQPATAAFSSPALAAYQLSPKPEGRPLLSVQGLQVHFPIRSRVLRRRIGAIRAVDGIDLTAHAGETVGLVGESGCGKTTTGRAIMGLVKPTGGSILFDGERIDRYSSRAMRKVRRNMQYIFQDPYSSLNPVLTAEEIVAEPLRIQGLYDQAGGNPRIAELFDLVGLPRSFMSRYPREFSGGQKQRIGIARALSLQPRLLILDEPVAALDVSIQAQIINLLQDLQKELALAYLFIAHDLAVVRHISHRVAVMYLGRVIEESDKRTLYDEPMHPYTQSLLSAVPVPDPSARGQGRRIVLQGEIPSPASPPSGCTFHPRCFRGDRRCVDEVPAFLPAKVLPRDVPVIILVH